MVDTGVLVSAFAFGGVPREVLSHAIRTADVYVSPLLLEEYRDVPGELLTEEKVTPLQWQALIAGVASFVTKAKVVFPRKTVTVCRDAEDNMVLECCLTARANVLVTGDKDLLELGSDILRQVGLGKLLIVSPRVYRDSAMR